MQNSLLLSWLHLKSSGVYIVQLLPVVCHEVYGKNSDNSLSKLLLGHQSLIFKNCLLPLAPIVLSQEQNNYDTAQGLYFVSYPV